MNSLYAKLIKEAVVIFVEVVFLLFFVFLSGGGGREEVENLGVGGAK